MQGVFLKKIKFEIYLDTSHPGPNLLQNVHLAPLRCFQRSRTLGTRSQGPLTEKEISGVSKLRMLPRIVCRVVFQARHTS